MFCSKRSLLTCAFYLSLALPPPVYAAKPSPPSTSQNWTGIIITALVVTTAVGGIAYRLGYGQGRSESSFEDLDVDRDLSEELPAPQQLSIPLVPVGSSNSVEVEPRKDTVPSQVNSALALETPVSETTRIAKIDIVTTLMQDLQSPDPDKRRKAIWDLGQQGDSRALLPMVDLMRDSDSSQRSLILAAVSEIGMKTLSLVNRALMLSLQDGSSDVRKNGIRDATRIYDLVGQVSQLLQYAASDPDQEVQETALWALTQLNRIRSLSGVDDLHRLTSGLSFKEIGAGKKVEG